MREPREGTYTIYVYVQTTWKRTWETMQREEDKSWRNNKRKKEKQKSKETNN